MKDAPEAEISRCHQAYCKLTRLELPLKSVCDSRIRAWADWLRHGGNVKDLELVILHLKKQIQAGGRNAGCLKFNNLIVNVSGYQDELAYAKAEQRNAKPPPSEKDKALAVLRPTVPDPDRGDAVKQSKEVIAALLAAMHQEAL